MRTFTKLFCFLTFLFLTNGLYPQEFDGYTLYNHTNQNTTYLIDKNGDIAHTWSLPTACNYTVLLKEDGNIIRGGVNNNNAINGAAVGGLVQEFDPQGNLIWGFTYSTTAHVSHHDITIMPNDNVLLTAWEVKGTVELQAMGYTGTSSTRYPTHFIEVSQDGTGGEIVWEWHIWDHLIQDVDPNKPNFGVVADHPELMDINVSIGGFGGGFGGDWFHVNGVDYNEELDQIVFSSRFLSEIFIIDHSTTTAEAAGHTGGNSGKGGDFLYRWGNPSNFGASGAQTISGPVHDARWIPDDGRPRGGYIQFFNNEGDGFSSTVDAIELPFAADGYNYEWTAGQQYQPTTASFRHTCLATADGQSASNSMPNGNIFVALSDGFMYEIDVDANSIVWQYAEGPRKGFRYTCDYPGVQALINEGVIEDLCGIVDGVDEVASQLAKVNPNPSTGIFNINGLTSDYQIQGIQVFDIQGNKVKSFGNTTSFDLSGNAAGVYFVNVQLDNHRFITKKVMLVE